MRGSLAEDNPYVSFARGGTQCLAGRRPEINNTRLKQHKGGEIHAVLLLVHKVYGGELRPWDLRTRIAYKERTQVCGTAEKNNVFRQSKPVIMGNPKNGYGSNSSY